MPQQHSERFKIRGLPPAGRLVTGAVAAVLLAACSSGGGGGGAASNNNGGPPPPPVNRAPSRIALTNISVANAQPTTGGYAVGDVFADDPDGDTVVLSIVGGADEANFTLFGNRLLLDDGVLNAAAKGSYEVIMRGEDPEGLSIDVPLTVLVTESLPLTVGYYDTLRNDGRPEQATPIGTIGETAVNIGDITAADLSGIDMLFVQNPSSVAVTGPYADPANLDKVAAFVDSGGVLIFHDRYVTTAADYLPGFPGELVQDIGTTRTEIELIADQSFVAQGPGGTVDDTNLEGPNGLSFGFAYAESAPRGSTGYLSRNDTNRWISYSYPAGAGHVIYSSLPLDFYLLNGTPANMRDVYAPNVLAEGRALRHKGVDTDGDGLHDAEEMVLGSDSGSSDGDGDGLPDLYEVRNGLNPNDNGDPSRDNDADGLNNTEEHANGSHPRIADSDGDSISDGDEVNTYGTSPALVDTDGDDLADGDEINDFGTDPTLADTDGGGTGDGRELLVDGTDPLNPDDDLNVVDLPVSYNDGNGFLWDVQRDGNINNGSNDAYDGGMRLVLDGVNFGQFTIATLSDGLRELRLGLHLHNGLQVSRRIFVPEDAAFVRYLEILENPTGADIAVQLRIDTNLGSDGNTLIISTSDGDTAIEPGDTWVVTDDTGNGSGDPSLAHVVAGPSGVTQPVVTAPLGRINYTYDVTVPAGGRAIVMHFDSQNANRTVAIASANALVTLSGRALDGIPAELRADVVNFGL